MIDKHIQPDSFTPPLHALQNDVRKSLNELLEAFKSQFTHMKQVLKSLISLKCKVT